MEVQESRGMHVCEGAVKTLKSVSLTFINNYLVEYIFLYRFVHLQIKIYFLFFKLFKNHF